MGYSKEAIEQAKRTPIREVLANHGWEYKETGKGFIEFKVPENTYAWFVSPNNSWKNRAGENPERDGYGAINFLKEFFGYSFIEAMGELFGPPDQVQYVHGGGREKQTGEKGERLPIQNGQRTFQERANMKGQEKEAPKEKDGNLFSFPEEPVDENGRKITKHVWAYLVKTRHIDPKVAGAWIDAGIVRQMVVRLPGKKPFYNALFAGYDKEGRPAHGAIRGLNPNTKYQGEVANSNKNFSARWIGQTSGVRVYESTIDAMSWCSLHPDTWRNYSHVILNGVFEGPLLTFLEDRPASNIIIGLDNDEAGQNAFETIRKKVSELYPESKVYKDVTLLENPNCGKDWNELLCKKAEAKENGLPFEYEERFVLTTELEEPTRAEYDFEGGTIYGVRTDETHIVIPSKIGGIPVTAIGMKAFENSNIESIELPPSVKTIGYRAFAGCNKLENVIVPEQSQLQNIGRHAFRSCGALTEFKFPQGLDSIGGEAFIGASLKSVEIPGSVKEIGARAFAANVSLSSVILNEGVSTIGEDAFRSCTSLQNVELPSSLHSIEDGAFGTCVSLEKIKIPNNCEVGASFQDSGIKTVVTENSRIDPSAFHAIDYVVDPETDEVKEVTKDRRSEIDFSSLNELEHATGHRDLLNRDQGKWTYASEELIAEIDLEKMMSDNREDFDLPEF